jgi:hypothetical protein
MSRVVGGVRGRELPTAALLGILAGASVGPLLAIAALLGRWIPSLHVDIDYAKGVLWAFVLGATIALWPVRREEKVALAVIWVAKCVMALGFMLVYEWNYDTLDAYGYWEAAQGPSMDWAAVRPGAGIAIINAMTWLHAHWLIASYHATKVTCSMVGLLATFVFYRAAGVATGRRHLSLLLAVSLFPSVLFWSSILGKDPFVLLGIALYAYGATAWLRGGRPAHVWTMVIGSLIAVAVRPWLGPILTGPVILFGLRAVRSWRWRAAILAGGAAVLAGLFVMLRTFFQIETFWDAFATLSSISQRWAWGGSAQLIQADLSDPVALLKFLPLGMVTALFRPLPGEVMNPFGLLAGLENVLLLALLAVALVRSRWDDVRDPVIAGAITFVIVWALVYGPISYQNLGSAVRYRLQVLPIFLLLLLYLARRRGESLTGTAAARSALPG